MSTGLWGNDCISGRKVVCWLILRIGCPRGLCTNEYAEMVVDLVRLRPLSVHTRPRSGTGHCQMRHHPYVAVQQSKWFSNSLIHRSILNSQSIKSFNSSHGFVLGLRVFLKVSRPSFSLIFHSAFTASLTPSNTCVKSALDVSNLSNPLFGAFASLSQEIRCIMLVDSLESNFSQDIDWYRTWQANMEKTGKMVSRPSSWTRALFSAAYVKGLVMSGNTGSNCSWPSDRVIVGRFCMAPLGPSLTPR